ncbi:hypothetical protein UlMin_022002 [Ulmus minor]
MYRKEETFPRRRRTPSFSSTLLDSIYRSIDESKAEEDENPGFVKASSGKKDEKARTDLRRAIMIESWVEKQSVQSSTLSNSASSSSESSSGAAWSSSETESSYRQRSKPKPKPKPVRTGVSPGYNAERCNQFEQKKILEKQQKPKNENGGFSKTKLRALKIYGELKKVKQPISPGGRIASFLNSIFNSGNEKKAKMCNNGAVEDVSSEHVSKSACSSASTFSRSCLSKHSSTRSKHSNGAKRTVRFYPVSVILGEDSQPCGHKCLYEEDPSLMPLSTIRNLVINSSLKEDPKKLVRKVNGGASEARDFLRGFCDNVEADDEDEEDDGESYSSSDLFELDHLVGIGRYREELPVYETTSLKTNKAIANGMRL